MEIDKTELKDKAIDIIVNTFNNNDFSHQIIERSFLLYDNNDAYKNNKNHIIFNKAREHQYLTILKEKNNWFDRAENSILKSTKIDVFEISIFYKKEHITISKSYDQVFIDERKILLKNFLKIPFYKTCWL